VACGFAFECLDRGFAVEAVDEGVDGEYAVGGVDEPVFGDTRAFVAVALAYLVVGGGGGGECVFR
jgi:hypothetical protein